MTVTSIAISAPMKVQAAVNALPPKDFSMPKTYVTSTNTSSSPATWSEYAVDKAVESLNNGEEIGNVSVDPNDFLNLYGKPVLKDTDSQAAKDFMNPSKQFTEKKGYSAQTIKDIGSCLAKGFIIGEAVNQGWNLISNWDGITDYCLSNDTNFLWIPNAMSWLQDGKATIPDQQYTLMQELLAQSRGMYNSGFIKQLSQDDMNTMKAEKFIANSPTLQNVYNSIPFKAKRDFCNSMYGGYYPNDSSSEADSSTPASFSTFLTCNRCAYYDLSSGSLRVIGYCFYDTDSSKHNAAYITLMNGQYIDSNWRFHSLIDYINNNYKTFPYISLRNEKNNNYIPYSDSYKKVTENPTLTMNIEYDGRDTAAWYAYLQTLCDQIINNKIKKADTILRDLSDDQVKGLRYGTQAAFKKGYQDYKGDQQMSDENGNVLPQYQYDNMDKFLEAIQAIHNYQNDEANTPSENPTENPTQKPGENPTQNPSDDKTDYDKNSPADKVDPEKLKTPEFAKKFPFCLPWDFIACIKVLKAEKKAPVFELKLPAMKLGKWTIAEPGKISIDFTKFDTAIKIMRAILILAFIITLILLTKSLLS